MRDPDRERLAELPGRLADGRALTEVWELRRADGSTVPVEVSMRSAGHGRRQSIGRDITARVRAEAEREDLLRREREANRNLRVLQGATAALALAEDPEQVVEVILGQAGRLEPVGAAVVLRRGSANGSALDVLVERGATGPLPRAGTAEHPLAAAVRTGEPQWDAEPLALPLVVSDRAIGAVGMWFTDGAPGAVGRAAGRGDVGGRAVRPGAGPGPAAPGRARGRRRPAAQPAARPAARAGPARRRGPVHARPPSTPAPAATGTT